MKTSRRKMGWLVIFSAGAAVCGVASLVIAAFLPSYIDADGFLHEPFAWMATGRILLIVAALAIALHVISSLFRE